MELYILDSLLRREQVVDQFESLIWTERYSELGDFELVISSTPGTRSQFLPGTRLAMNNSYRVMEVESVEDKTDDQGESKLTVKGPSLESSVLTQRFAIESWPPTGATWLIQSKAPAEVANYMFDRVCRVGAVRSEDVIPFLMPGRLFPDDTPPGTPTPIDWEQEQTTLYDAIKAICDAYDLGFRLLRNFDTSQLYFEIYYGQQRTTKQSILPPVVFSPNLDNLQNTTELTTIQESKNVAYVYSGTNSRIVYADGVDPYMDALDRRLMVLDATELLDPNILDINAALDKVGKDALKKSRGLTLFDGELHQYSQYRYGIDYNVGDWVEMRNIDGIITSRRITEQIFVCDGEGERSYPTLSSAAYDGSNTWLYRPTQQVWADLGTDQFWGNQS